MSSENENSNTLSQNSSASADGQEQVSSNESNLMKPVKITDPENEKSLRKKAKQSLSEAKKLYKRGKKHLASERREEVEKAINDLSNALKNSDYSCRPAHDNLNQVVQKHLKFARKSNVREVVESLLYALAFALVLRTFFIEPYKIPTRSMVPTLLEGDQLFVTKLSYGIRLPILDDYVVRFSEPQRGDVIVFAFPNKEAATYLARTNSGCMQIESLADEKDYIKRIIGLEGDTIEVIDQIIHVNGVPVSQQPFYERTVSDYLYLSDSRREFWNREIHGDTTYTTITHQMPSNPFGPIKVQPGHVFVMGDNRDNSADSRCWGQVPISNIKGRAQIIWWSSGSFAPRWERMFTKIY